LFYYTEIDAKIFASLLFHLINANISVNEQPEWFHWAHRRWPFYAYLRHVHVLDHGHFTDIVSTLVMGTAALQAQTTSIYDVIGHR
jgi:hypothetical protein